MATSSPRTVQASAASHRHGIDAGGPTYCSPTSPPSGFVSPVKAAWVEKSTVVPSPDTYSMFSSTINARSV
jgi:hypothetical protein